MSVWRARGFRCLEFRQFGCGDLEISYLEPTEPTVLGLLIMISLPRGSRYTTIVELGPKRPSLLWFWDPNSIIGVFMDPLGYISS